MAILLVLTGTHQGTCIPLNRERTLLGRGSQCDVLLNLPSASREHARITAARGQYYLEDLSSRNGTFLNGHRLTQRARLQEGDRLRICECLCSFHEQAPAGRADAPTQPVLTPVTLAFPLAESDPDPGEEPSTIEAALSPGQQTLQGQSTERLKALLEISARLSRTLDPQQLLHLLLERLFDLFKETERGFVVLLEAGRPYPALTKTRSPQDEPRAVYSRNIVRHCLSSGQGLLSEEGPPAGEVTETPPVGPVRSVLCAPLTSADGKVLGAVQLDVPQRVHKFTEADLALLLSVAGLAGTALENARFHQESVARERMQRDLVVARHIQRGFLPQCPPELPGYEFFAHYEPALEVSGDYYDFVPLPGGRLAVAVGDVAGKGIPAALLMAKLSAETRYCLLAEPHLAAAMSRISALLAEQVARTDGFVTLLVAVLDPATHALTLASAGHTPPLLHRASAGELVAAMPTDAVGLPLGVAEEVYGVPHALTLAPGDYLVVFTDGVTDAMDATGHLFRVRGIRAAMQAGTGGADEAGRRVLRAMRSHARGQRPVDNITILCVGRV
jgi:phosphoserine phosphatase RsbU/P